MQHPVCHEPNPSAPFPWAHPFVHTIRHLLAPLALLALFPFFFACGPAPAQSEAVSEPPHIVFVTGDEEYRSEESMPMLGRILERELGAEVTVCYALDSAGYIDPNTLDHIAGLEALEDADLMVLFTRFRALPDSELRYILDYANSGRPMVGFRTATHPFRYEEDSSKFYLNERWPAEVFGQHWITHHGHFEDGEGYLTSVEIIPEAADSPILNGVEPFEAYSWLYHVQGGGDTLSGDSRPLLRGTSLRSNHQQNDRLDRFPLTNPVAWTKSYTGATGQSARVFFTTLGHPFDFKQEPMRKLALNGIFWALGREDEIPPNGVGADFVQAYDPNNSGFGEKFKQGLRPD